MRTKAFLNAVLGLACVSVIGATSLAAEPAKGGIPASFAPQAGDFADDMPDGSFMGIAQLRGRALKPVNGVVAIYVVRVPQGRFKDDPFLPGDLIVAAGNSPLKEDPVGQFKRLADRAQQHGGKLTFTRWRKGVTETVNLTFDGPQIPDLTNGGEPDPSHISWNLGATGAAGWTWAIPHQTTQGAKQIYVTRVDKGSPADGRLKVGDVILGVNGANFTRDARKEIAHALTLAESAEKEGKLPLIVWNAGQTREVTIPLRVLGSYSDSAPYNCSKTDKIIEDACAYLLKKGLGGGVTADVNALGLLATGREDVMPLVRQHAQKLAAEGQNLAFKQAMESWSWGYHNLFLCEYYLVTKDASVLPAITEYSTMIARGQSNMGNYGHSMCIPYLMEDGPIYGVCPGYGALNQAGLPCLISLTLANKCGVDNKEIAMALRRGAAFFRYYVDRGAIPYGDHQPGIDGHDDNGKSSLTAVFFDLLGEKESATFFTKLTIASHSEREGGHTGNYFSFLWGPLGAARGGDAAASAFVKQIEWFFDLERRVGGEFIYQGKPGMVAKGNGENSYNGWDCTGARLLAYSLGRKNLYITGKGRTVSDITGEELADCVDAGMLEPKEYRNLSTDQLLAKLTSWSPAVRARAAAALGDKPDNVVPQLMAMLDSDNRYARYGACQGLREAGRASMDAADAVVTKGLLSDDQTMKFFAMRTFNNYDKEMGLAVADSRVLPIMLKLAIEKDPGDPDGRMKGELAYSLFYSGNASKIKAIARNGQGIEAVDSDLLVAAVRELLKVNNGGHRSTVSAVYNTLTDAQLKLLWKDIYRATRELAPADIMFADGIQVAGLRLMAKHRTQEGLDTAVWYLTNMKLHGGRDRATEVFKIIGTYGGHAKSKIPLLEKAAKRYEDGVAVKAQPELVKIIREGIKSIEAAPTPDWPLTSIAEYLK